MAMRALKFERTDEEESDAMGLLAVKLERTDEDASTAMASRGSKLVPADKEFDESRVAVSDPYLTKTEEEDPSDEIKHCKDTDECDDTNDCDDGDVDDVPDDSRGSSPHSSRKEATTGAAQKRRARLNRALDSGRKNIADFRWEQAEKARIRYERALFIAEHGEEAELPSELIMHGPQHHPPKVRRVVPPARRVVVPPQGPPPAAAFEAAAAASGVWSSRVPRVVVPKAKLLIMDKSKAMPNPKFGAKAKVPQIVMKPVPHAGSFHVPKVVPKPVQNQTTVPQPKIVPKPSRPAIKLLPTAKWSVPPPPADT
jgi:hypothetical protein